MSIIPKFKFLVILLFLLYIKTSISTSNPVVIFHSLGDNCQFAKMKSLIKLLIGQLNTYTVCLESAGDVSSIFNPLIQQSEHACGLIRYYDPNLQDKDLNIIGIGQGALIARFLIETCEGLEGRVKKFISIGCPHMGIAKLPCIINLTCSLENYISNYIAYNWFVQDYISMASYYKDNHNYNDYYKYNKYLPMINNEVELNETYKENFKKLEKLVLIKFTNDTKLIPKESAWFEFYDASDNIVKLEDSEFYKNDLIGLKYLVEEKKVDFIELKGEHLEYTDEDVINYIIPVLK